MWSSLESGGGGRAVETRWCEPTSGGRQGSAVVGRRAGAARQGGLAAGAACGTQTLSVIAKAAPQLSKEYRSHDEKENKAESRVVDREAWVAGPTGQVSREHGGAWAAGQPA
jgi:hypothetical protein